MTVDLIGYAKMKEQITIQEAAAAGIKSMEHVIFQLSLAPLPTAPLLTIPLKQVPQQQPPPPQTLTLDFTKPITCPNPSGAGETNVSSKFSKDTFSISRPMSSSTNSSFLSSITGDGSHLQREAGIISPDRSIVPTGTTTVSAGKPHLSSSYKKKCPSPGHSYCHGHSHSEDVSGKYSVSGGHCQCSKRRKVDAGLMRYKPDIIISVHPLMQHIPLKRFLMC